MENNLLQFNILELLCLLGLVHCVYIVVHLIGRNRNPLQIIVPVFFFYFLSGAFVLSLAQSRWESAIELYNLYLWGCWGIIPTLSTLIIIQVLRITKRPPYYLWGFPLLFLLVMIVATSRTSSIDMITFYNVTTLIIGSISLLSIWIYRDDLSQLVNRVNGQERFWVIMSLIVMNSGLLGLYLFSLVQQIDPMLFEISRTIIGLGFIYLGSTSLFRIYPHTVDIKGKKKDDDKTLSGEEIKIAGRIENLLLIENVYQEPGYNRTNLAQELGVSETHLSRIVSLHFDKTVPQLLNSYRVEEAKTLLKDTRADIATIAYESGFNAPATFHRVFKEITNVSPTEFRKQNVK